MVKNNNKIPEEVINRFIQGRDDQKKIISMECGYSDQLVSIIYKDNNGDKMIMKDPFYPFLWAKQSGAKKLFINPKTGSQNRGKLKERLEKVGIKVKSLNIYTPNGDTTHRMEDGFRFLFIAKKPMSYSSFIRFFREAGVDIYGKSKEFLSVSPVEQHMISTGKRLFKGIEDYDELTRLSFDLETGGLNPKIHGIDQIGIRTNKGYEKIIEISGKTREEKNKNEIEGISELFKTIKEIKPDVVIGHNSENFDWDFINVRCEVLGTNLKDISEKFLRNGVYKSTRKTVLKLGGEVEYFYKTNMWGVSVVDSLHAVRRAQAIDSNMKEASLKYVTKYSKLNKINRVYIPGDKIVKTWNDTDNDYAFNNEDGSWYIISDEQPLKDNYEIKDGKYIVERYLQDDLYETDKVELRYNQPNFLLSKILPTTFARVCTMGTAGIWKLLMMAWSFEHSLGIPDFAPTRKFTGGLSRLLTVGYVSDIVKLDYNSLYPSIDITWDIKPKHDISNVMLSLLEYVLTQRERYKDLKGDAGGKAKKIKSNLSEMNATSEEYKELENELRYWLSEENSNDKKQLPLKITGNSFFGSFGNSQVFPWGDIDCAEKTTCIGRQGLRLMVKWFGDRGYKPIVGDSFTSDTPVFVKYNDTNLINIIKVSEIFDENNSQIDLMGMEYDCSYKNMKVLSRSGWVEPSYIYRHKTNKDIHRIKDGDMVVDVTSDHSLFDENKVQIHSKEITNETKLEYYNNEVNIEKEIDVSDEYVMALGENLGVGDIDSVPIEILNSNVRAQSIFFNNFMKYNNSKSLNTENRSKVCLAGLFFIKNKISNII